MTNYFKIIVLIVFGAFQSASQAQLTFPVISGNGVYKLCGNNRASDITACKWFVAGATEGIFVEQARANASTVYCQPNAVTNDQFTDIYINYLKNHPELRHKSSVELLIESLQEAFPCK